MGGLMLCSRQAEKPYFISEFNLNVYSVEEIAYYLYNNVYFVDSSFFCSELAAYIREELQNPHLAQEIEKLIKFKGTYAEFVLLIVKASDYYDSDEIKELEYILDKIGNKTVDERMVIRADILMRNRRYSQAFKIYKDILFKKNPDKLPEETLSQIWYNMGIVYAKRFEYIRAAECFAKACQYNADEEKAQKLILAYMLAGDNNKAEESAVLYKVSDEDVERIRLKISECRSSISSSADYKAFSSRLIYDGKINLEEFYTMIQDVVDGWKEEYREEMA